MAIKADIHIQALVKKRKTILKSSFASHPFKIMDITEDKRGLELCLMLMSSSPGVLDEDCYNITVELEREAFVRLETQSYQRLFQMKKGASQQVEIRMQEGACFYYLPHPSVPHLNACFTATNKIYLSQGCTLLWGEVLTCGRKVNDEVFRFSYYHNRTDIFLDGQLLIRENLLIKPATVNMLVLGQLEGFTHQASFIFLHPTMVVEEAKKQCAALLSAEQNIEAGITTAPLNGIIIRLLGYKAEQLHRCLKTVGEHLLQNMLLTYKKETSSNKSYAE